MACFEAKEHATVIQASVKFDALGTTTAGAVPKLVELGRTSERSDVAKAKATIQVLGKIHHAEATLAGTRQEILDGFMACFEAKEHATVIQASVKFDALGTTAAGAVPKLVELGRTSERSDVIKPKATIQVLGKIHNYRGHARGHAPGDPRQLGGMPRGEGAGFRRPVTTGVFRICPSDCATMASNICAVLSLRILWPLPWWW